MPDGPFFAVASGADPLRSFASLRMTIGERVSLSGVRVSLGEPTGQTATYFYC
jgi:hypothetical protein